MSYKFKKGDAVVSRHFGIGKVHSTQRGGDFPILVMFFNKSETYTSDGYQFFDDFDPVTDDIIIPATKLAKYLYEVDSDNT
jgi:hypothetical protein